MENLFLAVLLSVVALATARSTGVVTTTSSVTNATTVVEDSNATSASPAIRPAGYCGLPFHEYSGCKLEKKINQDTIMCYKDLLGYSSRSRVCVEGIFCTAKVCNKATGNRTACRVACERECVSLLLNRSV